MSESTVPPRGAVKVAMGLANVPVGPSRSPIVAWSAEQKKAMQAVLEHVKK